MFPYLNPLFLLEMQFQMILLLYLLHLFILMDGNIRIFPIIWLNSFIIYLLWLLHVLLVVVVVSYFP